MGKFLVLFNQALLHLDDRKAQDLLKKERDILYFDYL